MSELRIGKVSSIDATTSMVKVHYEDRDSVTGWLPYITAGNEYNPPSIGSSVLVGHLSTGGCDGVVIGTYWNKANVPSVSKGFMKQLSKEPGEAYIKYDETTKEIIIKAEKVTLEQGG